MFREILSLCQILYAILVYVPLLADWVLNIQDPTPIVATRQIIIQIGHPGGHPGGQIGHPGQGPDLGLGLDQGQEIFPWNVAGEMIINSVLSV